VNESKTTTVFKSGNSKAVRLPRGFDLPLGRVEITKEDGVIRLSPPDDWPEGFLESFKGGKAAESWKRPAQSPPEPAKEW